MTRIIVAESTIDLCNTIMGTGMLSIPFAFSMVGWGLGVVLVFFSMIGTWLSLRLLVASAEVAYSSGKVPVQTSIFIQEGEPSYGSLAHTAVGRKSAAMADLIMALSCFGFSVSYLVSIGCVMPTIIQHMLPYTNFWLSPLLLNQHFWSFGNLLFPELIQTCSFRFHLCTNIVRKVSR